MRNKVLAGTLAVAIAAAIYFGFFARSDEEQIRKAVARLAHAVEVRPDDSNVIVRTARVRSELNEVLDENVHVSVPELTNLRQGRREVAEAASQASLAYRSAEIDVADLQIKFDPTHESAKAGGRATLRATTRAGEDRRDMRAVDFLLRKDGGAWRITSVTVWPH